MLPLEIHETTNMIKKYKSANEVVLNTQCYIKVEEFNLPSPNALKDFGLKLIEIKMRLNGHR